MILLLADTAKLWMKWVHVLGMVVWVGGLLGVTRLMGRAVRYADRASRADAFATYRRAHLFVDWGGLGLMLLGGLWIFFEYGPRTYFAQPYFHLKLTCVVVLLVCDVLLTRRLLRADPDDPGPATFYRVLHGVAGLALMGTLLAVFVVKG